MLVFYLVGQVDIFDRLCVLFLNYRAIRTVHKNLELEETWALLRLQNRR